MKFWSFLVQFSPEKYREKYHDILHQSKYRENIVCIEKTVLLMGGHVD